MAMLNNQRVTCSMEKLQFCNVYHVGDQIWWHGVPQLKYEEINICNANPGLTNHGLWKLGGVLPK